MDNTPNMGLAVPSTGPEAFDFQALAENAEVIDQHDHAPGNGLQIQSAGLEDDAVTTAKIAPQAVTLDKLAPDAQPGNVGNGSITNAKIADGSVNGPKVSASLKPSGSAAAGTESLRALGTTAGTAAAGSHATQHGLDGADPLYPAYRVLPNVQTANYVFALADRIKVVESNSTSALVFTIPPDVFAVGDIIEAFRLNTGALTIAAGAGVTLRSIDGKLSVSKQNMAVSVRCRANNDFVVVGGLSS